MSFLLPCPQCGPRDVYEFRWGGARSRRPEPGSPSEVWAAYLYLRDNPAGRLQEWWYHRMGCRRWFLAVRDTRSNEVVHTFWLPRPTEQVDPDAGAPPPSPQP
jgi:heterotetrameric sarcosine oxidase delta subunit